MKLIKLVPAAIAAAQLTASRRLVQQQIAIQLAPPAPSNATPSPAMSPTSMTLFGDPDRPWDASEFTASDDRVRGGRSQSHLTVVVDENGSANSSSAAKFWGHLDITALGGAGFASQRTVDDFPVWDLSAYDTLVLDVAESDGKKYTVTLKDEVLPKRPDGREQSTVSWEYDFKVAAEDAEAAASSSGPRKVVIPFADFAPTYRGKPKPNAEPLDLKSVKRVSFMMRSFFGEQEGDFAIVLESVSAERRGGSKIVSTQSTVASSSEGWGLMSWIGSVLGWNA